ncbi:hypothetical protein JAAARDRAFT_197685 [Jaapia argillacea MUCL 33604]|uniref:Uncharacterized protein n=1 Tax=Jaapia argillacea MUCL 33604 TaxID=933084 RepID=A0A067PE68_9AGAM|nr:hypothetical protein JAAARDRAFT_197685 [Jaapia argillacea MUCL 33604]
MPTNTYFFPASRQPATPASQPNRHILLIEKVFLTWNLHPGAQLAKILRSPSSFSSRYKLAVSKLLLPRASLPTPSTNPHDSHVKCVKCAPTFLRKLGLYAGALALRLPVTSFLCGVYALYGYTAFHDAGLVNGPPNPLLGGVVGAIGGATIELVTSGVLVKSYIKQSRKHCRHSLPITNLVSTLTSTSSHAVRPKPEFLGTILPLDFSSTPSLGRTMWLTVLRSALAGFQGFLVIRLAKFIPFDFPNVRHLGLDFNRLGLWSELDWNLGWGLGMNVAMGAFGALSLSWILVGGVRVLIL